MWLHRVAILTSGPQSISHCHATDASIFISTVYFPGKIPTDIRDRFLKWFTIFVAFTDILSSN